ncbi:MAG: hypothetical protein AB7P31_13445 [Steroidobacteraceae bacterium]
MPGKCRITKDRVCIDYRVIDGKTKAGLTIELNDKVVFNNLANAPLQIVTEKGATSGKYPFCRKNQVSGSRIVNVDPHMMKVVTICTDYTDKQLAYTGTIENAAAEDPIIIIEDSKGLGNLSYLLVPVLGGVALLAIGYFIGRWRSRAIRPA